MMKPRDLFRTLAASAALVLAVTATTAGAYETGARESGVQAAATIPPVTASDQILGRADAPVTVVEYASFVCSHCADWHNTVLPEFKTRFIDTGKVRLVFRNLPTDPANAAYAAAGVAHCAAPGKFFEVAAGLFAGQAGFRAGQGQSWFGNAVAATGRPSEEIRDCFQSPATQAAIEADVQGAAAAGVDSTPSFFINGRPVADRSLAGLSAAVTAATGQ